MVDTSQTLGLILIIGGLIIIAFEFVHPGAFLLIPGTVVLAGGVMYTLSPGFLTGNVFGPLIVAVVAIAAMFATIPYYRRMGANHRPLSTTPDSLTGETGIVIAPVVPDTLRGKVRVHSEIWSARSDRSIPIGTRVRVQGGQGVSIWVQPLETEVRAANP